MLDMIHYKKFTFIELWGKLPCSEKPSSNSCHEWNTSYPNTPFQFIDMDFCIIFKSVWGSIFSIMLRTYAGRFGFWKILAGARLLPLLQNIHTSYMCPPSLQLNKNQSFLTGHKVVSADNLTTHTHLQPNLKISGAIPPLNLSAPMAHIGTILFYLNLLPTYISLKR